jgi:mannose-6-phosphate isomerase-like protein (cupin superfamily)
LHITVAPGSVFTGPADDPSVGLNLVESGELTLRLEAAVTVNRASGPEEVAAGTEFTLGPGESFIWPPNVAGELRNDGPEPVVQLLAFLAPAEEAAATPLVGTPAP